MFTKLFEDMRKFRLAFLFSILSSLSFNSYGKIESEVPANDDLVDNSIIISRINNNDIEVSVPSVIFSFNEVEIKLKFINPNHTRLLFNKNKINFIINGEDKQLYFKDGEVTFKKKFDQDKVLSIYTEGFSYYNQLTVFSLWAIIAPIAVIIGLIIFLMVRKR